MARLAMLIDLTRCIGCDACTVACKQENGTPQDVFFARVLNAEAGTYPNVKRVYMPVLCNHCENPACLKACPNKAIYKRPDGIVLIDQDRCRGTGACVSACPYGNIVLKASDSWYLPEDRAYERDFVRPRLNQNAARKCTFCAQRVDRGLDPACVVACPTTARIFGDTEDPQSPISRYVCDQKAATGRDPFKLLPEAGTTPANMYLGTMAAQQTSGTAASHGPGGRDGGAPGGSGGRRTATAVLAAAVVLAALLLVGARALGQTPRPGGQAAAAQHAADTPAEVWEDSTCAGCHGPTAMGSAGPPLAGTRLTYEQVREVVRRGKGMMPAIRATDTSDAELATLYRYVHTAKLDPQQMPVSAKVAQRLTAPVVGLVFLIVTLVAGLLALRVLWYWLDCAGARPLWPYARRYGLGRSAAVVLRTLVVDGLLVASLWKKDRFRWAMHGLLIYGFGGLMLADMLMQIVNPARQTLPLTNPIKLLANLGGLAVLAGIVYVRVRYARDEYVDNGLTLGRDYTFLNLLAVTILSGFVVEVLRYRGAGLYVQPMYLAHLAIVATLLVTAPFTRFQHAFVVPALIAMTKLTNAIAAGGVDLGFEREPMPGRHHKSRRIAACVLRAIDPAFDGKYTLRYYP